MAIPPQAHQPPPGVPGAHGRDRRWGLGVVVLVVVAVLSVAAAVLVVHQPEPPVVPLPLRPAG